MTTMTAPPAPPPDPVREFFDPSELEEIRKAYILRQGETPAYGETKLTEDELTTFVRVCAMRKLKPKPFGNHIHATRRDNRMVIQTGIDGYRLIADRTGHLNGISAGMFVEDAHNPGLPFSCTVRVKRKEAIYEATAYFREFAQFKGKGNDRTLNRMWAEKPRLMLEKCAEALALRRAFPEDCSGIYTDAELGESDENPQQALALLPPAQNPAHTPPPAAPPPPQQQQAPQQAPAPQQSAPPPAAPQQQAPAQQLPRGADAPLDPQRGNKFLHAIATAVQMFQVPWPEMAALLQSWSGRPPHVPVLTANGSFAPDVTVSQFEAILAGVKVWEAQKVAGRQPPPQQQQQPPQQQPPPQQQSAGMPQDMMQQWNQVCDNVGPRGQQQPPQQQAPAQNPDADATAAAQQWMNQRQADDVPF